MPHPLKALIEAADRAITAEDFDAVMPFYADDAVLVIRPGLNVVGKLAIRRAFDAIAGHFNHSLKVGQGAMVVLEGAGTALVLMESTLDWIDEGGDRVFGHSTRHLRLSPRRRRPLAVRDRQFLRDRADRRRLGAALSGGWKSGTAVCLVNLLPLFSSSQTA
jgi:ketosteroid isomerase-like protein